MTNSMKTSLNCKLKAIALITVVFLLFGCVHTDNSGSMAHNVAACNFTPALSVHCGRTPTTAFDEKGRLWVSYVVGEHVYVSNSDDLGKTFSGPVQVTRQPERIYTNGENRAKMAFGRNGEVYVSWTQQTGGAFDGDIRFSRSVDGGNSFEQVRTVNDDGLLTSHRFDSMLVNSNGEIFISWLDKRDQVAVLADGGEYTGAALYYSVSADNGRTFAKNLKVADYSCECCRIAMAETPDGNAAVFWRHIFGEQLHIRDHAFAELGRNQVITEPQWATRDNWELQGCPHHGPSMMSAGNGTYHISWFTLGDVRKGIFYGIYNPDTQSVGNLTTIATAGASHPYIAGVAGELVLVWKQFDGEITNIRLAISADEGRTWQPAVTLASTSGASDHPLMAIHNEVGWLSWHTAEEGLRLVPLNQINLNHLNR